MVDTRFSAFFLPTVLLILTLTLSACGGGDSSTPAIQDPPTLTSISLTPSSGERGLDPIDFVVNAQYDDGSVSDVSSAAIFSFSIESAEAGTPLNYIYGGSGARVEFSPTSGSGTIHITANYLSQSVAGAIKIVVQPPTLTSISLTPSSGERGLDPIDFVVNAQYDDGSVSDVSSATTFSFSIESAEAGTPLNYIYGGSGARVEFSPTSGSGTIHITASYLSQSATGAIKIKAVSTLQSVVLTDANGNTAPTSTTLDNGTTLNLKTEAIFVDNNGNSTNSDVTDLASWSSSVRSVATVDKGVVSIVGNSGTTDIMASYLGQNTVVITITAIRVPVSAELVFVDSGDNSTIVTELNTTNQAQATMKFTVSYTDGTTLDWSSTNGATFSLNLNPTDPNNSVTITNDIIALAGSSGYQGTAEVTAIAAELNGTAISIASSIAINPSLDKTPPQISVQIDDGRLTTTLDVISLAATATDDVAIDSVYIAASDVQPATNDAGWIKVDQGGVNMVGVYENNAINIQQFFNTTANGTNYIELTVNAWAKDKEGNISTMTSAMIEQTNPVDIANSNNPLATSQWYLKNTGQNAYAEYSGTASNQGVFSDLNLEKATTIYGLKGKGIVINVIDIGLDIDHPDFALVDTANSEDYRDGIGGRTDPSPDSTKGDHGTSVAGILAMAEGNGVGGVGIAPAVTLIGHNYLKDQSYANRRNAFFVPTVDIFNMSYGFQVTTLSDGNQQDKRDTDDVYEDGENLRDGLGAIYIQSGGNDFRKVTGLDCTLAKQHTVSCDNSAFEYRSNLHQIIVAAAANASGTRSSYSSAGPNIWITGFGGEYGENFEPIRNAGVNYNANTGEYTLAAASGNNIFAPFALDPYGYPAMITTDTAGCDHGYSRAVAAAALVDINSVVLNWYSKLQSGFNYGFNQLTAWAVPHANNPTCDYTNTFNGTSSAAPSISGVVALMLQANPKLSPRQVKDILARTARMPNNLVSTFNNGYILTQGTITNNAGFKFHNWYGFGIVDADAAVEMAISYDLNYLTGFPLPSPTNINNTEVTIGQGTGGGESVINVAENRNLTIEHVALEVILDTGGNSDEASLYLIAPSGTEHQITNFYHGVTSSYGDAASGRWVSLSSNAFYGEKMNGDWKLKMINMGASDKSIARWNIAFHGSE